jgi:hypothetical protein
VSNKKAWRGTPIDAPALHKPPPFARVLASTHQRRELRHLLLHPLGQRVDERGGGDAVVVGGEVDLLLGVLLLDALQQRHRQVEAIVLRLHALP